MLNIPAHLYRRLKRFYRSNKPKTETHLMLALGVLPSEYQNMKARYPKLFEKLELINKAHLLNKGFEDKGFIQNYYDDNNNVDKTLNINISSYD